MESVLSQFVLCTGLVQKAKKAKDKFLKRDGDDRPDTGSYESFYYGGVDPYMWEPQELGAAIILSLKCKEVLADVLYNILTDIFAFSFVGATRSHLDVFKKHRAARIDHYVIEVNKLIIRLEKVWIQQQNTAQLNHIFLPVEIRLYMG